MQHELENAATDAAWLRELCSELPSSWTDVHERLNRIADRIEGKLVPEEIMHGQ